MWSNYFSKTKADFLRLKTIVKGKPFLYSIIRVCTLKRKLSPHRRWPEKYYKRVCLSEQSYTNLKLISAAEGISIKAAADFTLLLGICHELGKLLVTHGNTEWAAKNRIKQHYDFYVQELIKCAKENGMDVGKMLKLL